MVEQSLSDALKRARKKARWTQDNLATAARCSRSLIASYEGGIRPPADMLLRILAALPEAQRPAVLATREARLILEDSDAKGGDQPTEGESGDMIQSFLAIRRSLEADLSGEWRAMWLTTVDKKENRNREIIDVRKRWNGSWQFSNHAVSDDNPVNGFLWVGRLELFDNKHLLGYYCARDRIVLAKGTLCLELQPNGRELVGVWDGLSFDTMWAHGMVAMCRNTPNARDPEIVLSNFINQRPKMPY